MVKHQKVPQYYFHDCSSDFFTSYAIFIKKVSRNLPSKSTTKYDFLCLSYSSMLTILHIVMTGNPFLTINKAKWGYPGFSSYFFNKGTPKEDSEDFVLACLTLYTETPFQQFPLVVSTISLPP